MTHEQDPTRRPSSSLGHSLSPSVPPPSPARFIRHRLLHASHTQKPGSFSDTLSTETPTKLTNNRHDLTTLDITDLMTSSSHTTLHGEASTLRLSKGFQDAGDDEIDPEYQQLLHKEVTHSPESTDLLPSKPSLSSSSTLVNDTSYPPHKPVPAPQVFARGAPPLHLPKLDAYLSSLPKPPFSSEKTPSQPSMFAPMDRLAKSAMSLEDLEFNSQIPPFWRNRKTLLGSAVSLVLGLTVSDSFFVCLMILGLTEKFRVRVQLLHFTAFKALSTLYKCSLYS